MAMAAISWSFAPNPTSTLLLLSLAVTFVHIEAALHTVGDPLLQHQQQQQQHQPLYQHDNHISSSEEEEASLRCTRRLSTYRIAQTDAEGRECWDNVSVWTCEGRCDSTEISDWKYPYKRSYHPVCVHAGRAKAVARLRNCEDGADPETRRYEYMEAVACNCQTCSSWDTRCEAPHNVPDERSVRVLALNGQTVDDDPSSDY